jgi:hypothetical protein
MSAYSVPSSKTNIFQSKLYTLIYCRHFRTYSRCSMFDWSDTVFRRRNVTSRRISNTVLQPRYWGSEADSPEVCRLWIQLVESNVWIGAGTAREFDNKREHIHLHIYVIEITLTDLDYTRFAIWMWRCCCCDVFCYEKSRSKFDTSFREPPYS